MSNEYKRFHSGFKLLMEDAIPYALNGFYLLNLYVINPIKAAFSFKESVVFC